MSDLITDLKALRLYGMAAGSTPLLRTLQRRPIEAIRSVYVEEKEVQR